MAENTKPVVPLLNVGVSLNYFCSECGEQAVGGDDKELLPKNNFRAEIEPWAGKCNACGEEVRTPKIIVFTQELKVKTDPIPPPAQ